MWIAQVRSIQQVRKIINDLDVNKDGRLDFDEFVKW